MEKLINLLGFVFFSLALNLIKIHAQDVCVQKTPCSCEFANGTGIDLTPSSNSSFFTTQSYQADVKGQYSLVTYYYHPCFDVMPKINASGAARNSCIMPLSVCRHTLSVIHADNTTTVNYKVADDGYDWLGSSNAINGSIFAPDGRSIKYSNGPSWTEVLLTCADTSDELHIYSLADPGQLALAFFSRNACLKQIEEAGSGRSFGSTLCIIFFSFVIFYLVLGICTKKFLMGATGVEVVPNLMFWSDLPNLVKDGWAFVLNGFKVPVRGGMPATSPDPNSYDSI